MRFGKYARPRLILAFVACSLAVTVGIAQEAGEGSRSHTPHPLQFPRTIEGDAGTVVVHVPQIDSWPNFEAIEGRLALEVTPAGESAPVFGVAEFVADTDPNLELRVVAIENAEITITSFPEEDDGRREQLDDIVRSTVQPQTQFVPLDVMLTYIAADAVVPPEAGLSYDPPPIFYSSTPAVLVNIDGEPILAQIPGTRLQYAVNTNWDLFELSRA